MRLYGRSRRRSKETIRDDDLDTYWQSDGAQPHLINIQFHRKVTVLEIALYVDYAVDESYTPQKMIIKAGSTYHDLVEIQHLEVNQPTGWIQIPVRPKLPLGAQADQTSGLLRAHLVQPEGRVGRCGRMMVVEGAEGKEEADDQTTPVLKLPEFSTVQFVQFSSIR